MAPKGSVISIVDTLKGASITGKSDTFFKRRTPGEAVATDVKSGV